MQARGACPTLFVQVNTGDEPQKAGVVPDELDAFLARLPRTYDLPVVGLMCIPPADADPDPHFALLAEMAARNGLAGLSMGMSDDFEAAIARGATACARRVGDLRRAGARLTRPARGSQNLHFAATGAIDYGAGARSGDRA